MGRNTLDKFEYKVRAEEIKELVAQGEYAQAAEIADTIDWRRVKSVMMLCTVSDLYKINRRYEDAKDLLLLAYDRHPGGRTILYSLCELCIKLDEIMEAVEYYKEFIRTAPRDSGRFILQYKLYQAQDVSLEERIGVLEELKKHDYREKWAFELALLYHYIGESARCVEECDELILWFGEGRYVYKAMELKMQYQPLNAQQQAKYDTRFEPRSEEAPVEAAPEVISEVVTEAVAEAMAEADITEIETQNEEILSEETITAEAVQEEYPAEVITAEEPEVQEEAEETAAEEPIEENAEENVEEVTEEVTEENAGQAAEQEDIQVKTMDVSQFNTINLQLELAEGLKEILGDLSEEESANSDGIVSEPVEETSEEVAEEAEVSEEAEEAVDAEEEFQWEAVQAGELFGVQTEENVPEEQQEEALEVPEQPSAEDYGQVEELVEIEEAEFAEEPLEEAVKGPAEKYEEKEATEQPQKETAEKPAEEKTEKASQKPRKSEKAHSRNLTKEEKELFGPYIQSRLARQKLVTALDRISLAACTGNVIVTGEEGMDILEMSKNVIRNVKLGDSNYSGRTAKISASSLNEKDVAEVMGQLTNGSLTIEHASELNDATVKKLCDILRANAIGIIVVLADVKRNMNKFLATHKQLEQFFNARIDMEAMSNEELVNYAKKYAYDQEYSIDDLGVLALHTRIDEMQTLDHAVSIQDVKDIMDDAIRHANRKTIGHFMDVLFGKRYDKEDMIILREEDFV